MIVSLIIVAMIASKSHVSPREDLRRTVTFLAAPEQEGRGVGTAGFERASRFMEAKMRALHLEPLGDDGGYRQHFRVETGVGIDPATRIAVDGGALKIGVDATPFGFSDDGSIHGCRLIAVGHGISAPELHHDDYSGKDVRGACVIAIAHEPGERDAKSPFRAPGALRYRDARYKAMNAREHGAKAILIVNDADQHEGADALPRLRRGAVAARAGILAIAVTSALGLEKRPGTIDLDVKLKSRSAATWNLVGRVAGASKEHVVIGAHLDHLGFGDGNSLSPDSIGKVHPGADDNASGSAAILEIARELAADRHPKRRVVVALFSGEELGLLGSAHFVAHPPVALDSIAAMLNLDMVGRLGPRGITVMGIATAHGLKAIVTKAGAADRALRVTTGGDGYGPSDHTSFYAKGIPVLFLFTGAHADYHRITDTADKIAYGGLVRVARFATRIARALRDGPRRKVLRAVAANPHAGGQGGGGGYGAYFGSIPDFSEVKTGVRITGVRAGSPADKAGLTGGDVIVKLGGTTIANLYDLTYALRAHRAGDVVEVVWQRAHTTLRAQATLGTRN